MRLIMRSLITILSFSILLNVLSAIGLYAEQQTAITKDGKKVIIKDDGTWEYAEDASNDAEDYNFRKTQWGMNRQQVKSSEQAKLLAEEDDEDQLLLYSDKVADLNCMIGYVFINDQLVRGKYIFDEDHFEKNGYLEDFVQIKKLLNAKYGEPVEDNKVWSNDLYKSDPKDWGLAVSIGHLSFFTKWQTDKTIVTLMLSGDNFEVTHSVEYKAIAFKEIEKEHRKKQKVDDL